MGVPFPNRRDAGRRLAAAVQPAVAGEPTLILGLPRGGVVVAFEVARALAAPLDVVVIRKLGAPMQPELAMGAIGEKGVRFLNEAIVRDLGITPEELDGIARREHRELERRVRRFRGDRAPLPVEGRTVVVVDDGLATGATATAAVRALRARGAGRIVVAVPVGAPEAVVALGKEADEVVCLEVPSWLMAIGAWYEDFTQVEDEEVERLLAEAAGWEEVVTVGATAREVVIDADGVRLPGDLTVPASPLGVVVFAHGSGSSRLSPRNRFVAERLNRDRLATLLFDLLTEGEEDDRSLVFDIPFLAVRLTATTRWLRDQPEARDLPVGYFGASTGAGAALWAAAQPGAEIAAVVSRGGRPDLARPHLGAVAAPTLLIVGGWDEVVIELNREAEREMTCPVKVEIVPGATHLFEEPGTLEAVADLAAEWFRTHLGAAAPVA